MDMRMYSVTAWQIKLQQCCLGTRIAKINVPNVFFIFPHSTIIHCQLSYLVKKISKFHQSHFSLLDMTISLPKDRGLP